MEGLKELFTAFIPGEKVTETTESGTIVVKTKFKGLALLAVLLYFFAGFGFGLVL